MKIQLYIIHLSPAQQNLAEMGERFLFLYLQMCTSSIFDYFLS